jgi:hypothetical protein
VRLHVSDQSSVVDLNALDGVCDDTPTPHRVGSEVVGKDLEQPLDDAEPPVSLGHGEAEPAAGRGRPRADVSELGRVLRRRGHLVSSVAKRSDRLAHGLVLRVGGLQEPEQDATVGKDEHQS